VKDELLQLIRHARDTGNWEQVASLIPYSAVMGFELVEGDGGQPLGVMRFRPQLVGNPAIPALHGGAIGSLLESTAASLVLWKTDAVAIPKTVSITMDYFRPAKALDTYCSGRVTRLGRRVVNVRVEAWQDDRDKPVAAANATFLLLPDASPASPSLHRLPVRRSSP